MPKKTVRVFDYGDIKSITYNSVLSYYELTDYELVIREAVKRACGPMSLPMKIRYNGPGGKARCVNLEDSFFLVGLCVATKEDAANIMDSYFSWFSSKFNQDINEQYLSRFKLGAYYAASQIEWKSNSQIINKDLNKNAILFYDTL